ncbi:hypothetical protein [Amycolatopsis sp.]|uniref:hypothetical protein n=1 Tax=Amycolatopsis sp. TaxID=37632 RepID=UPI002DF9213B|nr:hypothetical protein [Amycolatopsis sp.]
MSSITPVSRGVTQLSLVGKYRFKRGYAEWSEADRDATDELAPYALTALDELRAASASLG